MVTGLCRALLRDVGEAEDAAQQTFLSAHRALLNGAKPREPAAWLATIARNECWARISARMRTPRPVDPGDDVTAIADPVAEAIRGADLAALWRAIRALPAPQRQALLLREFGGLRYDELAVAIGVSEPAVESLLFRARRKLRAAYAAVVGGAWLEPLARLLATGGAPVVATKAVALGLGTAAVTGSAVVLPKGIDHAPPARRPPVTVDRRQAPAPRTVVPQATRPAVHHVAAVQRVQAAPPQRAPARRPRRDGGEHARRGPGPGGAPAEPADDGLAEIVPAVEAASTPPTTTTTTAEPSHEGHGSGGGRDGGSDDGSRHDGSSGPDD